MKKIKALLLVLLIPVFVISQSVSPQVVSSAGDFFEGTNVSLSWTLGEIATETLSNGNVILTQGFQQPFSVILAGIDLDVLVYLEGPYSGTEMRTDLNTAGEIPLNQPYNTAPWNYSGTESVLSIPNSDVVDWVMVELRDAADAVSATSATTIAQKAGFILKDGSVVDINGTSNMQFTNSVSDNLFVVVWHRNHLGVMSSGPLTGSAGVYTYNFSTDLSQAYGGGAGYKLVGASVYGMPGGDFDGDGDVDDFDKAAWASTAGTPGYQAPDFNMDNQVNNPDKDDIWVENTTLESQVPD
ncbi:MAG: hypothetical protein JW731_12730 [Bacteroidales bacterium]|nr:hypothetical protein [Bacteroidales bacterium]